MKNFIISFVHGYKDENLETEKDQVPCLIKITEDKKQIEEIHFLKFPRTPKDFFEDEIQDLLIGENPMEQQRMEFKKLPRFGVMGLTNDDNHVYAATWNGIYKLSKENLEPEAFITNRLINDPHGIYVDGNKLYTVLTALDLVVITDTKTGKIDDYFSITRDLEIERRKEIENYDWRFISKQERGAVGNWHFNHISKKNNKLYLTSRLTSSLVEIDLEKQGVKLRTVCWDTPVMIHDGRLLSDGIVFTSVDGKILIANPAGNGKSSISSMKETAFHTLMERDFVNTSIRIGEILGKEINWCRGIDEDDTEYVTTTDGRYDQEYPYFNVTFVNKESKKIRNIQVPYTIVDFSDDIRYMTGFSIIKI